MNLDSEGVSHSRWPVCCDAVMSLESPEEIVISRRMNEIIDFNETLFSEITCCKICGFSLTKKCLSTGSMLIFCDKCDFTLYIDSLITLLPDKRHASNTINNINRPEKTSSRESIASKNRIELIGKLLNDGKNDSEISSETGFDKNYIANVRRKHFRKYLKKKSKNYNSGQIFGLLRDGKTYQEISEITGIKTKTLPSIKHKYFRDMKVKRKKRGG